jgi:hypothetical protein
MHPRRLSIVLSLIAVGSLAAACGSGASSGAAATGAAATSGAIATQNPEASLNVGGAASGLSNLQSYKMTMQVTGASAASIDVVVINGALPARSVSTTSGSEAFRIIEIGEDVWVDSGTGTYIKGAMTKVQADAMLVSFDPGTFMANLSKTDAAKYLQPQGVENKNGVNAAHFHADSTTPVPAGASQIPAGATADLWVAVDGGYLVALEAKGFSTSSGLSDTTVEVTNINDSTLTVSPPA